MKALLEVYSKYLGAATRITGVIAGVLLFVPALSISYEVVMRGLFNAPTEWAVEGSVYCVLVAGFLGMPITYEAGKHINVDIIVSRLSPKARYKLEIVSALVGLLFCAVVFSESWDMAMESLDINRISPSTLRVPLWIPQLSIPIGFFLLVLQFIRTILEDILRLKNKDFGEKVLYASVHGPDAVSEKISAKAEVAGKEADQ